MKNIICLIALFVSMICLAEPPNSKRPAPIVAPRATEWNAYSLWGQSWNTKPQDGDLATFNLPHPEQSGYYVSFLTTTFDTNDIGDLTGKSIEGIFEITVTGGAPVDFLYGYEGTYWDKCKAPANVRLYFTETKPNYDLRHANNAKLQVEYWWCDVAQCNLDADFVFDQPVFLEASLDNPAMWSDSQGTSAVNRLSDFRTAVKNVRQIGFSFGGGCFYDTGVGVCLAPAGFGNPICTFHLKEYWAFSNRNPKSGK